jgi:hypothetical protein
MCGIWSYEKALSIDTYPGPLEQLMKDSGYLHTPIMKYRTVRTTPFEVERDLLCIHLAIAHGASKPTHHK